MNPSDRRRFATLPTSTQSGSWLSRDDPRVATALDDYLGQLQAGARPSRAEFLARYPDISDVLADCLDGLEFVQSAAADLSSPNGKSAQNDALPPSTKLGDYRILREIGRGGMGVVYEAEQLSLNRRVALKVLPPAAAIDPKQRQRFQVEAQAAAHLHHPHIVPVFAVGCDHGISYFAMQFIEGRTLSATIRDLRRFGLSGKGSIPISAPTKTTVGELPTPSAISTERATGANSKSGLPGESGSSPSQRSKAFFRSVAHLGVQVAGALEHAHSLGVLHRDIKPANLLLDTQGELWVTDFGLARFKDDPGPTRTGDLLGTLRYMSPEQVEAKRGVVDQRADIYALGATLYELATLRPAFDGRDRAEVIRQILFEEPIRPRKVDPSIPRELETILMKAMAKEPASRYATAQELADDLNRFLEDKPILACWPTFSEQASKWVRRHRALVATAASVVVVSTIVASILLWQEQRRTAKALERAEKSIVVYAQGMKATLMIAQDVVMNAMQSVSSHSGSELSASDRNFFALALKYYESIDQASGIDPKYRAVQGKAQFGIGLTRSFLKQPGWEEAYRRSVAIYEELCAANPTRTDLIWDTAASLKYLGLRIHSTRGFAAAEPIFLRLLALEREMIAREPHNDYYKTCLATDLTNWGQLLGEAGRTEEAEKSLREAVAIKPGYPHSANGLAWFLSKDPQPVRKKSSQAVKLARGAVEARPKSWMYWNTLGLALVRDGDWKGAIEALETSRQLNDGGVAHDWFVLSMAHFHKGDLEKSREFYDKGVEWMNTNPKANLEELQSFRLEAAKLLHLPTPTAAVAD
ncbi:MAG: prkC 6 [Planctomycetota bacterium]|nr:prkC 6 [Planctomycetota bacterium]